MGVKFWAYDTTYEVLLFVFGLKAWRYGCMEEWIIRLSEKLTMQIANNILSLSAHR
jgi:hypothetical protein